MAEDDRINKIAEDIAYMRGKFDSLDCISGGSCKWSLRQKAVAGSGISGAIAALIMAAYSIITGGK